MVSMEKIMETHAVHGFQPFFIPVKICKFLAPEEISLYEISERRVRQRAAHGPRFSGAAAAEYCFLTF